MTRLRDEHRHEIALLYDRIYDERDRRYTEVSQEREKALKIKEQADRDALQLDRTIRDYKDEKANELREQINTERLLYASKDDVKSVVKELEATLNPIATYVTAQQGRSGGLTSGWGYLLGAVSLISILITIFLALSRR